MGQFVNLFGPTTASRRPRFRTAGRGTTRVMKHRRRSIVLGSTLVAVVASVIAVLVYDAVAGGVNRPLVLAIVSGIACAIPAWHASKVDPMTALRSE